MQVAVWRGREKVCSGLRYAFAETGLCGRVLPSLLQLPSFNIRQTTNRRRVVTAVGQGKALVY